MPTVPTPVGPRLETAPLPNTYRQAVDVSAPLRAMGAALSDASDAAGRIAADKAQTEAWQAQAKINQSFMAFDSEARKANQGVNAAGYSAKVAEWWDKAAKDYGGELTPLAQRLVTRNLAVAKNQALESALGYERVEGKRAKVEAFDGAMTGEINRAGGDPTKATASAAIMADTVAAMATTTGWPKEYADKVLLQYQTTLHTNVLKSLAQDPVAAKNYYELHKDQIGGDARVGIEKDLQVAGMAGTAQVVGAQLARQFDYSHTKEAQEAIDALPDAQYPPPVKAAIRNELDHRHAAQRQDSNDQQADLHAQINTMVQSNASLAQITGSRAFLGLKDQGYALKLVKDRQEHQAALQASIAARDYVTTQRLRAEREYQGKVKLFEYMDPQVLATMSRKEVQGRALELEPGDGEKLLNRFDSLVKSESHYRTAVMDHDQFNTIAATMGVDPIKPSTDEKKKLSTAKDNVEAAIDVWQRQHGNQEMPRDLKGKMMADMLATEVVKARSVLGISLSPGKTNMLQMTADERARVIVPDADRTALIEEARTKQRNPKFMPKEEQIRDEYLRRRQLQVIDAAR